MTPLIPIALGLLLQSTALLGVGLIALRLARRRGPAVQSLVGRATLAGVGLALLLAAPLTGHVRPLWRITIPAAPILPAPNPGATAPDGAAGEEPTPPQAMSGEPTPLQAASPPEAGRESGKAVVKSRLLDSASNSASLAEQTSDSPERPNDHLPAPPSRFGRVAAGGGVGLLAAAWGLGTALLLLWLGVCQCHLTRLRRRACPVTAGPISDMLAGLTPRPLALLSHPSVRSPFLAGLQHPAIFLPTTHDTDFDPTSLRAILAHELAHLARRDNAWTLAARLLCAVLWPQPLLWVLCRRLEQIGEEACDQAVLAQNCPPRAYADCLLSLAERHPLGRRERALGAGVAPFRSSLGQRIGRILDKGTLAMSTVTPRLRLTVAALSLAAALGGAFLVSSAPAQTATPAPQGVSSPQRAFAPASPSDDRKAILTSLDAKILSARILRQRVVHELADIQRASTSTTPAHQIKRAQLSRNYELTEVLLNSLLEARAEVAAGTKANTPPTAPTPLSQARFLAGLTPVQGPGVVVTLNDSRKPLSNMPTGIAPANIIHDTDINQVVNELKAAGAEAIAVNDQRLVATSSIRCMGPTVFINFVPTAPPFVIKAIGNPKTLAGAMNIPGGVGTQLKAYDPAMFSVREAGPLRLPAYSGNSEPRYARPAGLRGDAESVLRSRFTDSVKQIGTQPVGPPPPMIRVASEPKSLPDWTKYAGSHLPMNTTDLHCYLNMKQIALAIWGYTYHHNDRFPDADRWMDEIKPYLKTEEYYHDPAAPNSERYSYAYNRNLSGAAADRVSNMSETVMLFESRLNVRNASDTGQSLITPPRHAGHQDFVFVNIGGPAGNVRPSFALHIAPAGFYSTASPDRLAEAQKRTLARLVSEQSALPHVNQEFEGELRQALPQADTSKLTQARHLEMSIGLQVMELQNIKKLRDMPKRNRPSSLSSDWRHKERWTQSQLRPLLAQEAQLLPGVPGPQLARLHSVAASMTVLQLNVMGSQSQITRLNKERQRRRQPNARL